MIPTKLLAASIPRKVISRNYQVTVLGGASEIGQTVSLLLRTQPSISKLVIHDSKELIPGVVLDLSHVPTVSTIQGYTGENTLERALKNADLVIAAGGAAKSPGTSEKTWFQTNADFIKTLSTRISKTSPMPFIGIATEPINTLVPMASEIMKNNIDYDPKKVFGITSIDLLRAQAIYAMKNNLSPRDCKVPVIGGHSDKTIIPLLSQTKPTCDLDEKKIQEFTASVRSCEDRIIRAKNGWSPSLSVAYGILMFTRGILNALDGRPELINAYVENNDFGTSYFSGLVYVDQKGAGEMQRYANLSDFECHLLERSIEQLRKDVLMGKKILELA